MGSGFFSQDNPPPLEQGEGGTPPGNVVVQEPTGVDGATASFFGRGPSPQLQAFEEDAKQHAEDAAASATQAAGSAAAAAGSAQDALNTAGDVATYVDTAVAAKDAAQVAATQSQQAVATTQNSASAAATSATQAATSANNSQSSATAAATSATQAAASATNAASSASAAASSASSIQGAATTATNKAAEAAASATQAESSATAAAGSATTATTKASEAATSATNAAGSATTASTAATTATTKASEAATSASNAATSATNAATSASTATTKASEAATSATDAAASAATATTKASEASTSATNAAGSAATATTKASEASTSATQASTSATNAAGSATAAGTSATNAANSASAASTSATNAANSATAASNSASAASTSASNASTSATAAATAQTAAESARDATLAAFDSFDDRYLGTKTADPTLDNDGNPLVPGALYFNSSSGEMKVYTGSAWAAAYVSGAGVLLQANNLADLPSPSTARTNLGLATVAATGAYADLTGKPTNVSTFTNDAGYLTSFTEADPTVPSHVKAITATNITNWNTAYGWGNHASAGYLTGITSGQVTTALGYTPVNKAGDTFTGQVAFPGGSVVDAGGDFYARRNNGTTGVYYFADGGGSKYLYWDGTRYFFGGAGPVDAGSYFRAQAFYDTNNTAYYLDADSTSVLNALSVGGRSVIGSSLIAPYMTSSDFPNGTLVATNIDASVSNGDSFIIEITGKSYDSSNPPFKVIAQGYLYNDSIIAISGISYGGDFASYIKVFNDGGVLKFWWPRISYWNSFNVTVRGMNGADNGTITTNRVTSISDSTEPTGTKKVQINVSRFMRGDVSATNSVDLRAPIFYDSANTAYYLNPNSFSQVHQLDADGYLSTPTLYMRGNVVNLNSAQNGYNTVIERNTGNDWVVYGGDSVRAPIFYDSNDTAYYVDPASSTSGYFAGNLSFPNTANIGIRNAASDAFLWLDDAYGNTFLKNGNGGFYGDFTGYHFRSASSDYWAYLYASYFEHVSSVRAPIFYDSNDTFYYVDPAGTDSKIKGFGSVNSSANAGLNIMGDASNGAIIAFHRSGYYAVNMGLDTDNVIRIGGWSASANRWQLDMSGNNWAAGSMRAPIFYDSDNTAYYVNAASNSRFSSFDVDTTSRFFGGYGNSPGLAVENITTFARLAFYDLDFYDWDNGSIFRLNSYAASATSMRAPIFYDSDDTGYYVDSSSSSNIKNLHVNGTLSVPASNAQFWGTVNSAYQRIDSRDDATYYARAHWYGVRYDGATSNFRHAWYDGSAYFNIDADSGVLSFYRSGGAIVTANGSFRAPIFYDSDNTGYYVDPNGTSNFAGLTVAGQIAGSVSGYAKYLPTLYIGGQQLNPQTYFGSGDGVKVAMTAAAGVWSDTLWINGYSGGDVLSMCALHTSRQSTPRMWISTQASNATSYGTLYEFPTLGYNSGNTGGLYAGVFYDSNDTSYHCDPTAYSQFSSVYTNNWFRSQGQTGWYSQDYSGGIYMIDTTWVRVYGGKAFYVANEIAATGNITAYYSDERLKTKTGSIEGALAKVSALDGFLYVENDLARSLGYTNDRQQVGVSAQAVQSVLPEAVSLAPVDFETLEDGTIVSKSGENYLTVDYSRLVPLLIEAIKELKTEVDNLKATVH